MSSHDSMNFALAEHFNTADYATRSQQTYLLQKQAAANVLHAIQSGQLDLNQLSDDEVLQVSAMVKNAEAILQAEEIQKTASQNLSPSDQELIRQGQVVAHAQWSELQKIAAYEREQQRFDELNKLSGADWLYLLRTGQVTPDDISHSVRPMVEEKLASVEISTLRLPTVSL